MDPPEQASQPRRRRLPRIHLATLLVLVALIALGLAYFHPSQPRVLTIDVSGPNTILVNGRPQSLANLGGVLSSWKADEALIRARSDVPYQTVAQVLALSRSAGIEKVSLYEQEDRSASIPVGSDVAYPGTP